MNKIRVEIANEFLDADILGVGVAPVIFNTLRQGWFRNRQILADILYGWPLKYVPLMRFAMGKGEDNRSR